MAASSSTPSLDVMQPQMFINFRGEDVRNELVDSLVHEMKKENLNVFIDNYAVKGMDLEDILVKIEESTVAIAIFSKTYTNSYWCLKELARIKDCADRGTLMAIPIFYKISPSVVKRLKGDFGFAFRTLKHKNQHDPVTEKWEEAIASITKKSGMELKEHGQISDRKFIKDMIVEVKKSLEYIRKKADQRKQVETIQNIQPEAVHSRQPEAVQIRQPIVSDQGLRFKVRQFKESRRLMSMMMTPLG